MDFDLDTSDRRVTTVAAAAENRQSYRYPVLPGNSAAKLFIDDRPYLGRLTDESAGGFTVEVNEDAPVEMGQSLVLRVHSGWFQTQVRHVTAMENCRRVGLQRIKILPPPDGEDESPQRSGGSWLNYSQFAIFGLCMLVGGAVTLTFSQPTWLADWLGGRSAAAQLQRTAINTEFSSKVPDLRTTRILEGFNSLTDPKIAGFLKLSSDQVRNINSAYSDATQDLSLLFARSGTQNPQLWQQESTAIVNTTLQRVLCLLTDEQLKAWRATLTKRS